MGAQGQDDFLKLVPGVTLYDNGIATRRITIRGVASDAATNATTGVLIGDVPFTDPYIPVVTLDPNPFDLSTVEILKGPQGTLFGGTGLNGAIRYVPRAPVPGEWQTKGFAQYDTIDGGGTGVTYGGVVNIPAYDGDSLAFRLVGHDRRSPGWIDELQRGELDVNQINQSGGRALMLWQPNARWTINSMVMVQETRIKDLPVTDNSSGRMSRSNTPRPSPANNQYDLETIGIEVAFDGFDFLSQTTRTYKAYQAETDLSRIAGDRPPPGLLSTTDNYSESYVQEFRLTSNRDGPSPWRWLVGAFAQRVSLFQILDLLASEPSPAGGVLGPGFEGFVTEDGEINSGRISPDIQNNEVALYGEATRTLWDVLDVTVGLRAYRLNTRGIVTSSGGAAVPPPGESESVFEADITEQGANPKLALHYSINDNVALYLAAARGFRFGGIQTQGDTAAADVPETYKSDTIWNYELGVRTQWLDDTLIADLTPFYIDWDKPQLLQVDPNGTTAWIANVGGARSRGAELGLQYRPPISGLSLLFAASWVDTVTTVPFTTSTGVAIAPGSPWPLTPKYQAATTLAYQRGIGAWNAGASVVHTRIGEAYINLEQVNTVFNYATLDVQATLDNPALAWLPKLSLSLTNLSNVAGLVGSSVGALPDRTYIRPRTVTLRLATEF